MLENRQNLRSASGFLQARHGGRAVVAMQKQSSIIHNGIERTFTGTKTFIDIQNFCSGLFEKPFIAFD